MHSKKVNIKGIGEGESLYCLYSCIFFYRKKVNINVWFYVVHRLFTGTKISTRQ